MTEIRTLGFARHLRGEASTHILRYRKGRLVASRRGLSFWFLPFSTGIAAVMDRRCMHLAAALSGQHVGEDFLAPEEGAQEAPPTRQDEGQEQTEQLRLPPPF